MHEMSIAMNIVDIVSATVKDHQADKVNSIDLEIGSLSGILIDSLTFCFDAACKGTPAEGATLNIQEIQGLGKCAECHREFQVEVFLTVCPFCDSLSTEILNGKELSIKSINVD